jgi:coenzyme F420-reducing hydrogenase beta subunit
VYIHQYCGDYTATEANVSQGQVGMEEVHGSVEMRVRADGQDDEQISKQGYQVHRKEYPKEEGLQFWII